MVKIEILCPACSVCAQVKEVIKRVIKILEMERNFRPEVTVTHITDYKQFSKYGTNVSKKPLVVINGNVEFAGCVPNVDLLRKKLSDIIMGR